MRELTQYDLSAVCPACNAQVGHSCTQATDTGRRAVNWTHFSRDAAVRDAAAAEKKVSE